MTVVLDTSVLLALLNRRDAAHDEAAAWWLGESEAVRTSPLVLAEADHLLLARAGRAGAAALRSALADAQVLDRWWDGAAAASAAVAEQYADLALGLTDASLVVLADREQTDRIATLDHRHFRAVRPLGGPSAFRLLPHDT